MLILMKKANIEEIRMPISINAIVVRNQVRIAASMPAGLVVCKTPKPARKPMTPLHSAPPVIPASMVSARVAPLPWYST